MRENHVLYVSAQIMFAVLAILSGMYDILFLQNIFVATSLILFCICLAVTCAIPSDEFAKERNQIWWQMLPLATSLISAGFGWWFCFTVWLAMFSMLFLKTIVGKTELKQKEEEAIRNSKVIVEYPLNDTNQRE